VRFAIVSRASGSTSPCSAPICNTRPIWQHGPYTFGQGYTKHIVPKADDRADDSRSTEGHAKWEKHTGDIPEHIRNRLTEVISSNLKSAHPLPMVLKLGENVDHTHDLHVRTFVHNGHVHIGMHILCPNSSLK
jgi:hypothetical protein